MRIYFAGPLFTQAEREWNRRVAGTLRAAGHDVFLPQEAVGTITTLEANAIFHVDVNGVRSARAVVAVLDGADADSGTCFECGLAYALGIPIVVVRTDFRAGGDALPGQKLATINLMLSQSATEVVAVEDPGGSIETVARLILAALDKLPDQTPTVERIP